MTRYSDLQDTFGQANLMISRDTKRLVAIWITVAVEREKRIGFIEGRLSSTK